MMGLFDRKHWKVGGKIMMEFADWGERKENKSSGWKKNWN
jgi:hypothetical protein